VSRDKQVPVSRDWGRSRFSTNYWLGDEYENENENTVHASMSLGPKHPKAERIALIDTCIFI